MRKKDKLKNDSHNKKLRIKNKTHTNISSYEPTRKKSFRRPV